MAVCVLRLVYRLRFVPADMTISAGAELLAVLACLAALKPSHFTVAELAALDAGLDALLLLDVTLHGPLRQRMPPGKEKP